MKQYIEHIGVVKKINGRSLFVAISQQSSCSTCSSKSSCFSSGKNEMIVEVVSDNAGNYSVGDTVMLYASNRIGYIAVFYAYMLPLFILVIVLFSSLKLFGLSDLAAILLSFASLAVYYFIIYLFRDKLKNKINFELK